MEIDPKTGLPMEAITWQDLAKEGQRIQIKTDKKKYGKTVTVIEGFDKGTDMKKISKALKNELACGGTFNEDKIELQGEHRTKSKKILMGLGFDEDSIDIN